MFGSRARLLTLTRELEQLRSAVERLEAQSCAELLEPLDARVKHLELDNAERQIAVLTTAEKVLYQLQARERKRTKKNSPEDAPGEEIAPDQVLEHPPLPLHPRRAMRGF